MKLQDRDSRAVQGIQRLWDSGSARPCTSHAHMVTNPIAWLRPAHAGRPALIEEDPLHIAEYPHPHTVIALSFMHMSAICILLVYTQATGQCKMVQAKPTMALHVCPPAKYTSPILGSRTRQLQIPTRDELGGHGLAVVCPPNSRAAARSRLQHDPMLA